MNFKEITELIKIMNKSDLVEFKMKDKDFEIQIRTKRFQKADNQTIISAPAMPSAPVSVVQPERHVAAEGPKPAAAPSPAATPAEEAANANLLEIRSPIVGTFYRSSSPDKPQFVKVGDPVSEGQTVCIVEAMKLFNEIESEISGKIVKVMVEDSSPVEYDQVLFLVDPKG